MQSLIKLCSYICNNNAKDGMIHMHMTLIFMYIAIMVYLTQQNASFEFYS